MFDFQTIKRPINSAFDIIKDSKFRPYEEKINLLALKRGYTINPSPEQIVKRKFIIENLQIRFQTTKVKWMGRVDLRRLKAPLSSIVNLGKTHIEVYPNEFDKPAKGLELNRNCQATFGPLKKLNVRVLKQVCSRNQCLLLSVDEQTKTFCIQIPHFTKYKFNEVESDDTTPPVKPISSLVEEIRNKFNQDFLEEKSRLEQGKKRHMERLNRSVAPHHLQKQQIARFNQNNGHNLFCESGQAVTFGGGCALSTEVFQNFNLHKLSIDKSEKKENEEPKLVFSLLDCLSKINSFIINESNPLKIRRILSLYMITQQFTQVKFEFQASSNSINIVESCKMMKGNEKKLLLKQWFEWVINSQSQEFIRTKNLTFKMLAKRRVKQLVERSLEFGKFDDSQFLACIEDQFYRIEENGKNLSRDLKSIGLRDFKPFQKEHWITRMGVYFWYYNFDQECSSFIEDILTHPSDEQEDEQFAIEKYILSRFFLQNQEKVVILPSESEKSVGLIWWWFIHYQTHQKEIAAVNKFKKQHQQYQQYRQNLIRSLVQQYKEMETIQIFFAYDRFLNNDQKRTLARQFAKGDISILKSFERRNIIKKIDVLEIEGYQAFEKGRYLKALQKFAQIPHHDKPMIKDETYQVIEIILSKSEILGSFHKPTMNKIYSYTNLLGQNKLGMKIKKYFGIVLGKQRISKQGLVEISQLLKQKCEGVRKRMSEAIWDRIKENAKVVQKKEVWAEIEIMFASDKVMELKSNLLKNQKFDL